MNATVEAAERRKLVRLQKRPDLYVVQQRYENRQYHIVKDPVGLKYYRLNEQEYFVFSKLDGKSTLEDIQKSFESNFRPSRLSLEDLESFARQLVLNGLVIHETTAAGKGLFDRRQKQKRMKRLMTFSNILYMKIPIIDPDRLLDGMYRYLSWIFTYWFLFLSVCLMASALGLVALKFDIFWDKLPAYHEFFRFRTVLYMWIALGFVKVIHEFGHGLSCKAFRGECHEMGALLMCFSPALYCNVTDAWTLSDKWKRIVISFAGIYVELIIASIATFVWWNTPHWPFVNNIALSLMVLCSVSTFMFNANPLMRFDGYYILADWLEVPNLRERCNRFLNNQFSKIALGIEVPPEPYMAPGRKVLFIVYAIVSYVYRWVVTFSILYFLWNWLKPYKLESISMLLTMASVISMIFWPVFRLFRNIRKRGRLPDMKRNRVLVTSSIFAAFLAIFFLVPLPISRIRETGLVQVQEDNLARVYLTDSGTLDYIEVYDGQEVREGQILARFSNPKLKAELGEINASIQELETRIKNINNQMPTLRLEVSLRNQAENDLANLQEQLRSTKLQQLQTQDRLDRISELRAPRSGVVMNSPKTDELHKFWEKLDSPAFCSIGDLNHMRILLPVEPQNYRLLQQNLDLYGTLMVSIHFPGRSDKVYHGQISKLPQIPADDVPIALTSRGGGSLAVKPSINPNLNEPLTQTYLIPVEITDSDYTICPGTLATAKIHTEWKPLSWYVWRKIASAMDWGLL